MLTQPGTRPTFFRIILAVTGLLAWLAARDAFSLARKLGIAPLSSKTWLALLGGLILFGAFSLLLLALTFTKWRAVLDRRPGMFSPKWGMRWLGWPLLLIGLIVYPVCLLHPYYGDLMTNQLWMRTFIFWMMSLLAALGLKLSVWRGSDATCLLVALLLQSATTRLALYLPNISDYPFAMSWSETSRFYYPALFMSRSIFGEGFSWPILHPSLHLLLTPPYLLGASLWFHRFWQVALRFVMLGLVAPALLSRVKSEEKLSGQAAIRWLAGLWIGIYLLTLPLYLHLAVPVFIILWGFSSSDEKRLRMWVCLALASIWAGLSRLNWYPMPGMLAVALYVLETPVGNKGWRYLLKPALWFLTGTGLALLSMQVYILSSGIPNPADFYTSLSSPKLWFRLWPNPSYWLGVLPGILIFSLPLFVGIGLAAWRRRGEWHILRIGLLVAELLVLFVGGLLVSMKIGGGADIHNMDAFAVLLLVIFAYIFAGGGSVASEITTQAARPVHQAQWGSTALLALLVVIPAWFAVQGTGGFWKYDPAKAQDTLAALQQRVDTVNAQGGQILFITQRQLISMRMLKNVPLIPEYEREELMEMAMAQDETYLQAFRADLEKHRFAAIIVDPLRFNFVGEQDAMGAENNAWTRYVVKRILCNYKQDAIFPADRIVIYVPQLGAQHCP